MILEMTVAFAWLADRSGLRGLIVTGAGKAFCAGGDVNTFREGVESEEIDLPSEVRRGAEALHQAIVDLRRIPFPVIAAVNGPAAGAGFSLALACDMRIASEGAFFACAYGRIGASPDGGMTYFLPRVVGPSRALELLLDDPNMSAAEALAERLVTEVVPADELMERARERAEKLASKAPLLRADGETADRREHREQPHRAPAARAPRDRRQHGDRGPAGRRRGLLRRRQGRVHRSLSAQRPTALNPAGERAVSGLESSQPLSQERTSHEEARRPAPSSLSPRSPSSPAAATTTSDRPPRRGNDRRTDDRRRRPAAAAARWSTIEAAAEAPTSPTRRQKLTRKRAT